MSDPRPAQILYPWSSDHAAAVDTILLPWARSKGLHVLTQHGEAEVRCLPIVDDSGDTYELTVSEPNAAGELTVAVELRSRPTRRVGHREREQFVATRKVPMGLLVGALDEAFETILRWAADAGHTRTPA